MFLRHGSWTVDRLKDALAVTEQAAPASEAPKAKPAPAARAPPNAPPINLMDLEDTKVVCAPALCARPCRGACPR